MTEATYALYHLKRKGLWNLVLRNEGCKLDDDSIL